MHVEFCCYANSVRSPMAEGVFRDLADESFSVGSSGIIAHEVDPISVQIMSEVGVDISKYQSKIADHSKLTLPALVVDLTEEQFHSKRSKRRQGVIYLNRPVEDPKLFIEGSDDNKLSRYRTAREKIYAIVREILDMLTQN